MKFKKGDKVRVDPNGYYGRQNKNGIGTITRIDNTDSSLPIRVTFSNCTNTYAEIHLILEREDNWRRRLQT